VVLVCGLEIRSIISGLNLNLFGYNVAVWAYYRPSGERGGRKVGRGRGKGRRKEEV